MKRCAGATTAAVLLSAAGFAFVARAVPAPPEKAVEQALEAMPAEFHGCWRLTRTDGTALPAAVANYRIRLAKAPTACRLLKDKGISTLVVAEGATLQRTRDGVRVKFSTPSERAIVLSLKPPVGGKFEGRLTIVEDGKQALDTDVALHEVKAAEP